MLGALPDGSTLILLMSQTHCSSKQTWIIMVVGDFHIVAGLIDCLGNSTHRLQLSRSAQDLVDGGS